MEIRADKGPGDRFMNSVCCPAVQWVPQSSGPRSPVDCRRQSEFERCCRCLCVQASQRVLSASVCEAVQPEEIDGQSSGPVQSEIGQCFADSRSKFKAVSRETGPQDDVRKIRMSVQNEVLIGAH